MSYKNIVLICVTALTLATVLPCACTYNQQTQKRILTILRHMAPVTSCIQVQKKSTDHGAYKEQPNASTVSCSLVNGPCFGKLLTKKCHLFSLKKYHTFFDLDELMRNIF